MSFLRPTRDSVTTIGRDGSRRGLHPADVTGRFSRRRKRVAAALIALYLALPWIPVGGHPAVFLDVGARRFHLFGHTLGLDDIGLLFFAITGLGFLIYACTSLFGRIWCGWACPQTVFLEHVFRRVERLIEGDANARRALDKLPLTDPRRFLRRGLKAVVYLTLCWVLAHAFLAYFVSIPGLYAMLADNPFAHPGAFIFMTVLTGALFFNFWWFREQLCLIICPYGRLQSTLIDDDSVVIGYDSQRGEPRGAVNKIGVGACVDCLRCVQVCPVGIDIRQGLQMECVGCTACVDACDTVMDKLERPRGLIRHASLREFAGGKTRIVRLRTVIYAALLVVGAAVATVALTRVNDTGFKLTRPSGAPLFFASDEHVINRFRIIVHNKSEHARTYRFRLVGAPAGIDLPGMENGLVVPAGEELTTYLTLRLPRAAFTGEFPFELRLVDESGAESPLQTSRFIGPGVGR